MKHIFADTVLLPQILFYGEIIVKCSHSTSPYMNLKLHSDLTTVMILPAEIRLCAVSACVSAHVVRRNVKRGLSLRIRQVLNDAGLQQQMPVFVYKCANIHRHVFQKAYFRKWMHDKLFFDK